MSPVSAIFSVKVVFLLTAFLFTTSMQSLGQGHCLRGMVCDGQTGVGLDNVYVLITGWETGVLTDSAGYFELCGLQYGDIIEFSHLAYYNRSLIFSIELPDDLVVRLLPSSMTVEEVVITGNAGQSKSVMPGKITIDADDVVRLPSFMGESDVVRSLQVQAGVQSTGEGISDVFVRGGAPGQNMIVLDGMELMNPLHMMGLYSVFNPNTLAGVDLYKGHTPITYSERLSSLILVSSADPLRSHAGTNLSLGTLSSGLGHISRTEDGKLGITLGVRRSFVELYRGLSKLIIPDEDNYFGSTFSTFYDLNGLLVYSPIENARLSAGWFLSGDHFAIDEDNKDTDMGSDFGNRAALLAWEHKPMLWLDYKLGLSYTGSYSEFDGYFGEGYINLRNHFDRYSAFAEMEIKGQISSLMLGMRHSEYQTLPQDMDLLVSGERASFYHTYNSRQTDYYLEGGISIRPRLDLSGGVRLHNYNTLGWSDSFNDEGPFDINTWKKNRRRLLLSVSAALRWKTGINSHFKAAFSRQAQTIHLASIASLPLPNDIWLMSSPFLKPQIGHQVSGAYFAKRGAYELSIEVFARDMENQVLYTMGDIEDDREIFEERFIVGRGRVAGAEFMARKTIGRFTWDLAYTLLRSERQYDEINNGHWFSDKFDRRHNLALVGEYKINDRWSTSASFIYATGNCLNLPAGRMWVMGTIMNDYDGYNSFRMPPYHRLDISATYRLQTKVFKASELDFSVINVYDRANPYFLFYKVTQGSDAYDVKISAQQVSLFPLLPSIGWRVKF